MSFFLDFPGSAQNVAWSLTGPARVEPRHWRFNGGDHPIDALGNFLIVEADLPTLHLIGLYLELCRQSDPSLGTVRQRALKWGQTPDCEHDLTDGMAYLSGTKLNPAVITYSLEAIAGSAIRDPAAITEINSKYSQRSIVTHGTGEILNELSKLNLRISPAGSPPYLATLLIESTFLVIASAPTQAKVAQILRELEARHVAQPAAINAPPAN